MSDQPVTKPDAPPPVGPALRYGAAMMVAGIAAELVVRAFLGRMPSGESDIAGMVGFWFVASVLVVAMRLRPKRPGQR
jgi:hypothetical protein